MPVILWNHTFKSRLTNPAYIQTHIRRKKEREGCRKIKWKGSFLAFSVAAVESFFTVAHSAHSTRWCWMPPFNQQFYEAVKFLFFLLSPPQSFHSSSFLLIHNSWLFTSRSSFSANFQKDRKAFKASTKERKKNCGKLNLYNRCEYPKISNLSFSLCPTTIENTKLNGWEKRLAVTVVVVGACHPLKLKEKQ